MESKEKILVMFGERVRKFRKEKGLSQEQLAFKADLHRTYIGMIERAEKYQQYKTQYYQNNPDIDRDEF